MQLLRLFYMISLQNAISSLCNLVTRADAGYGVINNKRINPDLQAVYMV